MSKCNRKVRIALARTFGNNCMFKKSHAEEFIEKLGTIKTYKKFKKEKRYSPKQVKILETYMTLHHLRHKSEHGSTTEENGVIINELVHRYIHSLPRNQEEIINDYIREWKKMSKKVPVVQVDDLQLSFEVRAITFNIEHKKYDRIQFKRDTKELIKEYERGE